MTRKALILIYLFFFFMYFFGFGLMGNLNSAVRYPWEEVLKPLKLSRYFYTVVVVALAHFVVFRKFYHSRPAGKLILSIIILLAFFILIRYGIEEIIFPATLGYGNYYPVTSARFYIVDNIYYGLVIIFIGFVLYLFDEMFHQQRQQAKLKEENREAELNFLHAQMNPHFLFNSLNNIYSLAYERSPKTADAILKLSEMMRYVTYQRETKVELSKELEYVNSIIDIQQLRHDHKLNVQMNIDPGSMKVAIMPLLMVTIVENALKHGDLSDPAHPLRIGTILMDEKLQLKVSNKTTQNQTTEGGVGLKNLRRRLELSYQPSEYNFEITDKDNIYSATLIIPI